MNKIPKVIVIGNSPNTLKNKYGSLIDSYDVVIRINKCTTKGFEENIGSKTDIWATTHLHYHKDPLNHKKIGAKKPFELVIIQGGSGETDTKSERKIFSDSVEEIVNKVHASGAEAALYMIHAYVAPHKNANPKMITDIKKMYIEAGNKNNALVIPVGIAFENAYSAMPNIELHKPFDGSHPSLLGTYLAACVVFGSITQKSPSGLNYNYFNTINDSDREFLQKIAHETIESFYNIKL